MFGQQRLNMIAGASRAAQGAAAAPADPELIVNGDMSSATGWTLNTVAGTASISGGKLTLADPAEVEATFAQQSPVAEAGQTYRLIYTIDSITGEVAVGFAGVLYTPRSAPGTYQEDKVAIGSGPQTFTIDAPIGGSVVIDNVSLQKVV